MIPKLAAVAVQEAHKCFHGSGMGLPSNLQPIAALFPPTQGWTLENWDNCWCAAFVYYCCRLAGVKLPVRYPDARVTSSFAACPAWEQWARLPEVGRYRPADTPPRAGDIVLFDRVFENVPHDHIGIIVAADSKTLRVAEGNFHNVSCVVTRPVDGHIRCYIRMPD